MQAEYLPLTDEIKGINPVDIVEVMDALVAALGEVHAEKFVALVNREPFDYTTCKEICGRIRAWKRSAK